MGTYALAKEIETFFIQKVEKYNEQRRIDSESTMQIHSFIGAERNLSEHTDAFWSAFTPAQAGKGSAVEFVRKKLKMNTEQIIVCGDACLRKYFSAKERPPNLPLFSLAVHLA